MGLLSGLRSVLGMRAEADATREADAEDLFGMSTAHVTMEVEAILDAGAEETGTEAEFTGDSHGYRWVVLHDGDFDDLVTSVHFAADTLIERRYGSRLLAALFGFEDGRSNQRVYWVYSFRRGAFYPFAPDPDAAHERDQAAEFKLESTLDGELRVEDDRAFWYPLWPDRAGDHPWESDV